jgi:phosphoglycolate phosphatase
MARQFDLLVFDWDGTLMDSAGVITSSIQAACRDLNLRVPSDEEARHIIGLGLTEAIAALLPEVAPADYEGVAERYRFHFLSRDADIPLFEGVAEAIAELHDDGFSLAVATGKSRRGLDRVLQHSGLAPFFHVTRCADECFSKPHPAMLHEIMDVMGATPARTLMIGDTTHDLQMADNAGVQSLAAAYGAHPRDNLLEHAPLVCADSFEDIYHWIREHA